MKLWKFISALISATLVALMFSAIQGHAAVDRQCNYTVGSTTTATGFANCTEEIADLSTKAWAFPTVTGTDTIVGTSSPAVTTLSDGQMVVFKATGSNTGPTTFQLDGTSSASVYLADGSTAAGSGDIVSGVRYILTYQASPARWILLGTPGVRGVKITGDTMTGTLVLPAGTTSIAPLNIPHGSAPTTPVNGDLWTTTCCLQIRLNGSTQTTAFTGLTQTLINKTLTAPKIADLGFIADANGNEQIIFDTVTSAVNEVTFANAATGTNPTFTASGGDTNIGLNFVPKGSGTIQVGGIEIASISGTQTLTNKTLNLSSNTLTGTIAQFNTAISDADIQPLDSDLTALAGNSTAGLWASTAVGSGAARTLTAPAAGFTITNPAGTAGNPTFVLANDLAGVEGLASNGIATRTATDTWTARTITGTANEITLTNGDGVAGNPTVSLPAALTFTGKTITGGTFSGPAITTPGAGMTFAGSTSGTTTLAASAVAGTTALTLPAATDTLVGKATTDNFTNKTFDTAGTGNSFSINGLAATANTGTGAVVRATSPALVTPNLGTPSAATLTNATGLPISTGVSGLGTGVATALGVNKNTTGGIPLQSGTPTSGNCVRWAVGGGLEDSGGTCSGGGAGSPGGSSGNIQYNNAGAFGGLTDTQVTARLDNFVGDSGAGGTKGAVPAPSAGDAAAYKFLMADGTWKAAGSMKRSTKTAGYTLVAADRGNTIEIQTNSVTLSLTAAATLGDGWWAIVKNGNTSPGANTMTIDPNSTETIDGLTTSVDYPGATRIIYTNGTAFFSHLVHGGFAKFTSSGTFTIPPNLNQADVICYGAGGGGGGGGAAAAGTARASGAGGGGGAKVVVNFGAVALGSAGSGVTVTVGTGGTGGASTAAGNAGGTSSFGSLVSCYGGGPGGGSGTAATAQTGGSGGGSMGAGLTGSTAAILGGSPSLTAGAIGFAGMGAGANTGADGSAAEYGGASGAGRAAQGTAACAASTTNNGGSSLFGGGGGGNGGCITSTNVAAGDGVGGSSGTTTAGGGGATGTNGATCTNGTAGTAGNETFGGFGGGGGGSDTDSTGCTGGAGGLGGGGGGGGGGGTSTGGTGGAGGDGSVYVRYSWLGLPANDNENVMLAAVA